MAITMKQARVGADLTMEEIARSLGIHPQTYSAWEKNPDLVTVANAKRFAEVVGVDMDDIIFCTEL